MERGNGRCADAACVNAEKTADGVRVTSTIDGNDGAVDFTPAEWNTFIDEVKAGKWDDTLS